MCSLRTFTSTKCLMPHIWGVVYSPLDCFSCSKYGEMYSLQWRVPFKGKRTILIGGHRGLSTSYPAFVKGGYVVMIYSRTKTNEELTTIY